MGQPPPTLRLALTHHLEPIRWWIPLRRGPPRRRPLLFQQDELRSVPVCGSAGSPVFVPADCPNDWLSNVGTPFGPANPVLQPAPAPHAMIRRRAPAPPAPVGRGGRGPERPEPYPRPSIPSGQSAFVSPFERARNLFADFIPNIEYPDLSSLSSSYGKDLSWT